MADKKVRALAVGIAMLVTGGTLAGTDLGFLRPPQPSAVTVASADAIVVLGGDHGDRLEAALLTAATTRGAVFVVLSPGDGTQQGQRICRERTPVAGGPTLCLDAGGTRSEAKTIARLADSEGWDEVVITTSAFHASRAGVLFRRCTDAGVSVVASTPAFDRATWARSVARELAGLAIAALDVPWNC